VSVPVRHLTTAQLAERTGIPVPTLRYWRQLGRELPYLRLGRSIRYRLADVEAWERSGLVEPGSG
jgi:excisionase family DNA binding protein